MESVMLVWIMLLVLCKDVVEGSICNYAGRSGNRNSSNMESHIFKDPMFWQHFQQEIKARSWKCNFPQETLLKNLDQDATLYETDIILRKRRHATLTWVKNDTLWIDLILGACKEIAHGKVGSYSSQLQNLHMLEALDDFVEHLNCFYTVASIMKLKGIAVKPLSQDSSQVHDIDKLDPVMLVGYSERFEDNKTTSVWDACVNRHTHINPHHQAHCMWARDCCRDGSCTYCEAMMEKALSEMVCDKVSRRLQKNLNGIVSNDMWNVDLVFFKGLPQTWLDKALELMEDMKDHR